MAIAFGTSALASEASAFSLVSASAPAPAGFGANPQADCPAGKHTLSGGVLSSGAFNSSDTLLLSPGDGPDPGTYHDDSYRVVMVAFEDVTVTSYAICRNGPVVYRHKSIDDGLSPGERDTRTVRCPRGYRVTGGGANSPESAEVKSSRPVDDGTAWEGSVEDPDIATDWGVSALCVDGALAKTLTYKVSAGTVPAGEQGNTITDCPGHNGLVGGGTYIGPGASNLNSTAPVDVDEGWRSYVDHLGIGPALHYKTYAICSPQRTPE